MYILLLLLAIYVYNTDYVNVYRVNTVKSYDAWKIWAKYLRTMIPKQKSVWTERKKSTRKNKSCKKVGRTCVHTGWKRIYPTWIVCICTIRMQTVSTTALAGKQKRMCMLCINNNEKKNPYQITITIVKTSCSFIHEQTHIFLCSFVTFFWLQSYQSDLQMKCLRCIFQNIKKNCTRFNHKIYAQTINRSRWEMVVAVQTLWWIHSLSGRNGEWKNEKFCCENW